MIRLTPQHKENSVSTKTESPLTKANGPETPIDSQDLAKDLTYKADALVWNNFSKEHPEMDRWVLIWCNLGNIAQNLYLTYRDASGFYGLPHPTRSYPVRAWAYVDTPVVDQEALKKLKVTLTNEAQENSMKKEVTEEE